MTRPANMIPSQEVIAELVLRSLKRSSPRHGALHEEEAHRPPQKREDPKQHHEEDVRKGREHASKSSRNIGALVLTGNDLDIAIGGPGFFVVEDLEENQIRLTRNGRLSIDSNRRLVAHGMYPLKPGLLVPEHTRFLKINPYGDVVASSERGKREYIGTLEVAVVPNPPGLLVGEDGSCFPTEKSGPVCIAQPGENGLGLVAQGGYLRMADAGITDVHHELNNESVLFSNLKVMSSLGAESSRTRAPFANGSGENLRQTQLAGLIEALRAESGKRVEERKPLNRELQARLAARRLNAKTISEVVYTSRQFEMPRFNPHVSGVAGESKSKQEHFQPQEIALARRRAAQAWMARAKDAA